MAPIITLNATNGNYKQVLPGEAIKHCAYVKVCLIDIRAYSTLHQSVTLK